MSNSANELALPRISIKIAGTELPETISVAIVELRIELTLDAPSQAVVRFFDEAFKLFDDPVFKVGDPVKISVGQANALTEVFDGELVVVATDQLSSGLHELVITCYDKGHRLARSTAVKTYQKQSYGDILSSVAQQYGLSATTDGAAKKVKFEHITQTTDAATLLTQICRRIGAHWRVEGTKLNVFVAEDKAASAALTYGKDLIRFRTRFSGTSGNDEVTVSGWDPKAKRRIMAKSTTTPPGHNGTSDAYVGSKGKAAFGAASRATSRTMVASADEATQVATALHERATTDMVVARGETFGTPAIVPGGFVDISGVGTRLKGKYFVTSVEHVISGAEGFRTRFTTGPAAASSLAGMMAGESIGTALAPPDNGVLVGIVTNNKDPEGLGRVRVKFPAESDEHESEWARCISFMSGNGQGATFMPQLDTEVAVMFENGDRRRPVVLGSMWNGKDKPPLATDDFLKGGNVVSWQIKTAAGHSLTFAEGDDASQNITVALADGTTKLYLGKDKVELWSNNKNLEVKSGQASLLLKEGKDAILKGLNVTIQATQALKLEGLTVEIAGKTSAKLAGQSTVEITGGASTKISATGMTEVSGSMVKIN